MKKTIALIPFLLLFAQFGCKPSSSVSTTTGFPDRTSSPTHAIPTQTSSPTMTLLPSLTSTRSYPVWAGTMVPVQSLAIDPGNASRTVELARWMRGWVFQALYSPDGRFLAVGSEIGIYLYKADSLELFRVIEIPSDLPVQPGRTATHEFTGFAFSPDGKTLATDAGDAMLLWDVDTGRRLKTFPMGQGDRGSVAFFPDGKHLAVGLQFNVTIWDLDSGKETALDLKIYFHEWIAISPDGNLLAAGNIEGEIVVWDFAGGTARQLSGKDDPSVQSLAFSPDGKTLAEGSSDMTIKLWDVATGKKIRTLVSHEGPVASVAFSPDGKTLASSSGDGTVKSWNLSAGRVSFTLKAHPPMDPYFYFNDTPVSATYSPDGGTLVSATGNFTVQLWDSANGEKRGALSGSSTERILDLAFSPDGKSLAAGSIGMLRLWDTATGSERYSVPGLDWRFSSLSFSPDGKVLAAGNAGLKSGLLLVDAQSGQTLPGLGGEIRDVSGVAFSPDGKTLALATEDAVSLWNVAARREIRRWKDETNGVGKLVFSPDGKLLASSGWNGKATISLWNSATGGLVRTLTLNSKYGDDAVEGLAFSPDGKLLASGSFMTVTIWDAASGIILFTTDKLEFEYVASVAFSPDGRILASGSNTIILWEVATGKQLCVLKGHYYNGALSPVVSKVAFSPDGTLLASGSYDGTIRIWGVAPLMDSLP